ncbi:MAG: hypothetical protein WCH84_02755, partial [Verrucomicrobiota bacterium]
CGTESRLRRGVKGGRKISTDSEPITCFACFQFAKCNFLSFREHDLRSRTAERKPKNQMGKLEALPYVQIRSCRRSQQELSDRPILFGE